MVVTKHLQLPLLAPAQAQKHVTHNEALLTLDVLCQASVISRSFNSPPENPVAGDRYLVCQSTNLDQNNHPWNGKTNALALWRDSSWHYFYPQFGWLIFVQSEQQFVFWNGQNWENLNSSSKIMNNIKELGVGTSADSANKIALKTNRILSTALSEEEGGAGDLECAFNKSSHSKKISFLFQEDYEDRIRIVFDENGYLVLSISPDGLIWNIALSINPKSGKVHFPQGLE
jgi:hypothetical protein